MGLRYVQQDWLTCMRSKKKTDPDGPVFFVVEKMGFEPTTS